MTAAMKKNEKQQTWKGDWCFHQKVLEEELSKSCVESVKKEREKKEPEQQQTTQKTREITNKYWRLRRGEKVPGWTSFMWL